jgi:hypothetical protein
LLLARGTNQEKVSFHPALAVGFLVEASMAEIVFDCAACGKTLKVANPAFAGKKCKCPKCEAICTIPVFAERAELAAAVPTEAPATEGTKVGDRVFARWGDGFWYPAIVRFVSAEEVMVKYADGQASCLVPDYVRPLTLEEGDRVQARWQGAQAYYPATVVKCLGEKVSVHYDDGEKEIVHVNLIRVIRPEDIPWNVGDRVLANWMPEPFFYPAVISNISGDGFIAVDYDDGESAELQPGQVLPLELEEGGLVFARRKQGPAYLPAKLLQIDGDDLKVRYEQDGTVERTMVRYVRVLPPARNEAFT